MKIHKIIFLIQILLLNAACRNDGTAIDLAGRWTLELLECVDGETHCQEQLKHSHRFEVQQPLNLRQVVPWFFGKARLTRKFHIGKEMPLLEPALLVGAMGSADKMFLNSTLIGATGSFRGRDKISSAWMKSRLYAISSSVPKRGENEISIELEMLDFKAGMHVGPIKFGSYERLRPDYSFTNFIQSDFHFITLGTLLVAIIIFMTTMASGITEKSRSYLFAAFAAYLLYSLYFIEIAVPFGHILFLKIVMVGRVVSGYINGVWIQTLLTDYATRSFKTFLLSITGILSVLIVGARDYNELVLAVQLFHGSMVVYLGWYFLWFVRNLASVRPQLRHSYLFGLLWAECAYAIDFANVLFVANLPWINHYSAALYQAFFVSLRTHSLQNWENTAQEFRTQLYTDRSRIAKDMHDAIGADLSQILVGTKQIGETALSERLQRTTLAAIEKIKDIVYYLRNTDEMSPLREFIFMHTEILKLSPKYVLILDIDDIDLAPVENLAMQRIFAEWMSNVIRHAKPRSIRIILRVRRGSCQLAVWDDGLGIRWFGTRNLTGLGNIAERAGRIGAKVFSRRGSSGNVFYLRFRLR